MATVRQAVRVLLIDPADRVLLMQFQSPDTGELFWATIGGGIDAGESPEQAARREVLEEAGLADVELGPQVWSRRHEFLWDGQEYDQREQIFMARVEAFEPSASGHTAEEIKHVRAMRWWSSDELMAAADVFAPHALPALYSELLASGPPSEPTEVGV